MSVPKIEHFHLLEKLIVDNELSFEEGVRNSQAAILCGYADFLEVTDVDILKDAIEAQCVHAKNYQQEIEKVFVYAKRNSYGNYWKTEEAKKKYIF